MRLLADSRARIYFLAFREEASGGVKRLHALKVRGMNRQISSCNQGGVVPPGQIPRVHLPSHVCELVAPTVGDDQVAALTEGCEVVRGLGAKERGVGERQLVRWLLRRAKPVGALKAAESEAQARLKACWRNQLTVAA